MSCPCERRHKLVISFCKEYRVELLRNAEFVSEKKEGLSDDIHNSCLKNDKVCFNVEELPMYLNSFDKVNEWLLNLHVDPFFFAVKGKIRILLDNPRNEFALSKITA